MSRRARLILPHYIRLTLNTATGYYEATERGVLYQLTFGQMNELKRYCRLSHGSIIPTVESWYNSRDRFGRKEVKRVGAEVESDGFWADE